MKSYEHMGTFEVVCEAGCTCEPRTLDAHNQEKVSQLYLSSMLVSVSGVDVRVPFRVALHIVDWPSGCLADACQLKVAVLPKTSSGEHKVKLLGIVVSESTADITYDGIQLG